MDENRELQKIKKIAIPILKKNGVLHAGIFGSYARGKNKKNSDIDILVETKDVGLFEFIGIKLELEKNLKKKVDLVEYKAIKSIIKNSILNEEVKIL